MAANLIGRTFNSVELVNQDKKATWRKRIDAKLQMKCNPSELFQLRGKTNTFSCEIKINLLCFSCTL